jgi:hypothetical protein
MRKVNQHKSKADLTPDVPAEVPIEAVKKDLEYDKGNCIANLCFRLL